MQQRRMILGVERSAEMLLAVLVAMTGGNQEQSRGAVQLKVRGALVNGDEQQRQPARSRAASLLRTCRSLQHRRVGRQCSTLVASVSSHTNYARSTSLRLFFFHGTKVLDARRSKKPSGGIAERGDVVEKKRVQLALKSMCSSYRSELRICAQPGAESNCS